MASTEYILAQPTQLKQNVDSNLFSNNECQTTFNVPPKQTSFSPSNPETSTANDVNSYTQQQTASQPIIEQPSSKKYRKRYCNCQNGTCSDTSFCCCCCCSDCNCDGCNCGIWDCGDCDCGCCDCGGCDSCDCGGCDCGGCDCSGCDWGACVGCLLEICFSSCLQS